MSDSKLIVPGMNGREPTPLAIRRLRLKVVKSRVRGRSCNMHQVSAKVSRLIPRLRKTLGKSLGSELIIRPVGMCSKYVT
jgi:hypothetical protein